MARHTLSGSKNDVRAETPGGSGCLCVCVCWMCVKFKGLLEGEKSKSQTRAGTGMGVLLCPCTHKVHQRRAWEASHLRDTLIQQSFSVNQNNHASHTQTDNTVTMDTVNYQRERERTSRVQLFCSALDCKHGF